MKGALSGFYPLPQSVFTIKALCWTILFLWISLIPIKRNLSSVQFSCLVMSNSLWPHDSHHARPPCPSPTPEFTQTHIAYWAPTDLGSFSFSIVSFCLFILFMGFSRQEYWSGLPFPSPVDHILSDLSTMTRPSWVVPMYYPFKKYINLLSSISSKQIQKIHTRQEIALDWTTLKLMPHIWTAWLKCLFVVWDSSFHP